MLRACSLQRGYRDRPRQGTKYDIMHEATGPSSCTPRILGAKSSAIGACVARYFKAQVNESQGKGATFRLEPVQQGFECPITGEMMTEPVMTCDGHVYEQAAIEQWFKQGKKTSPLTNLRLHNLSLTPLRPLQKLIEAYIAQRPELRHRLSPDSIITKDLREELLDTHKLLAESRGEAVELRRQLSKQPCQQCSSSERLRKALQDSSRESLKDELVVAETEFALLAKAILRSLSALGAECNIEHLSRLLKKLDGHQEVLFDVRALEEHRGSPLRSRKSSNVDSDYKRCGETDLLATSSCSSHGDARHRAEDAARARTSADVLKIAQELQSFDTGGAGDLSKLRDLKDRLTDAISHARSIAVSEAHLAHPERIRRRVHNMIEDLKGSIRVFCRVRPLSEQERDQGDDPVVRSIDSMTLEVKHDVMGTRPFSFDGVFVSAPQLEVFEESRDLIQSVFDGYNVSIIAYGQTGSGKTYTMFGSPDSPGLAPRISREIFRIIERDSGRCCHKVSVSLVEIYRNDLVDLLVADGESGRRMSIRTDSQGMVQIENVVEERCDDVAALEYFLKRGHLARTTGATAMNSESSRSHLIMTLKVESVNAETGQMLRGKAVLVDLAGSERLKKSLVTGERAKETIEINKSLSSLADVIEALSLGSDHIPYRNHKLTQTLQDSLGRTAKTLMFVNCSPASLSLEETLISLKYATRAKSIVAPLPKSLPHFGLCESQARNG